MKKLTLLTLLINLAFIISACTSIVDATTNEPIDPATNKRSPGTVLDDQRLEVIVGVNIRKADPALKQSNIDINVFNSVVLITGQTRSAALKNLATTTATQLAQVKKVHNELSIKDNLSFARRTSDTWIASKVKIAFLADKQISTSRIKTIIEDGVVYFMGYVTVAEGNHIANIASNIRGVREVVKVFEYIN